MNTKSRIVGSHARFFHEGDAFTLPSAGTASATAKPDVADTGWADFDSINNLEINPTAEEKEVYTPNPGHLELEDVIRTKQKMTVKFDAVKLSPASFELAFRTSPLDWAAGAGDQDYIPDEGSQVYGWLKTEQYDQNDDLINVCDMWGIIKIAGPLKFDENIVNTPIEFVKLRSSLNAGTLKASA
jgi:hypothetical protein